MHLNAPDGSDSNLLEYFKLFHSRLRLASSELKENIIGSHKDRILSGLDCRINSMNFQFRLSACVAFRMF